MNTKIFFVCAHFFENTNMKNLLFPVFTNTHTKIFGFAEQHKDFLLDESKK